jgi:DNA-binding transcriptional MocR family regulator
VSRPARVQWRSAALNGDSTLSSRARLAAAVLAEYAGTGRCWPSEPTLAEHMAASERTVRDAIRELERAGFLTVDRRSGFPNTYWLRLPTHEVQELPRQELPGSTAATPAATPATTPATTPAASAAEPEEPEDQSLASLALRAPALARGARTNERAHVGHEGGER